MSGEKDIMKGRNNKAAGVLINEVILRAEEKTDHAVGQVTRPASG